MRCWWDRRQQQPTVPKYTGRQRRVISEDPLKMGLERIDVKTGLGSKERGRKGKQERKKE